MERTGYYSVTVRKFSVLSRHTDWMKKTQDLYNEILDFYYNLYLDTVAEEKKKAGFSDEPSVFPDQNAQALKNAGSLEVMRALEKMTIVGRDKKPVSNPLPWEKVPLYFRRAAINAGIAAARSFLTREEQQTRTEKFTESVTFYKGMYRDFNGNEISLKLWDGNRWQWVRCRLRGNTVPENGQMMSPALLIRDDRTELHIPWKAQVFDGRNAKERMAAGEKICSAVFTNKDALLVCCIMNRFGGKEGCLFLKGGAEYAHRCQLVLDRIEKSRKSGGGGDNPRANRKYWEKLKNLNDYYSHQFSRQVIDYCWQQGARVLVLPKFEENHQIHIMKQTGKFSPIHLSISVRKKLKYKAWQAGIVVLEPSQHNISSVCSACGGKVRNHGSLFQCENGHQGNRYLNTAWNLGEKCLRSFDRKRADRMEEASQD